MLLELGFATKFCHVTRLHAQLSLAADRFLLPIRGWKLQLVLVLATSVHLVTGEPVCNTFTVSWVTGGPRAFMMMHGVKILSGVMKLSDSSFIKDSVKKCTCQVAIDIFVVGSNELALQQVQCWFTSQPR